jgi:hypothetical protein
MSEELDTGDDAGTGVLPIEHGLAKVFDPRRLRDEGGGSEKLHLRPSRSRRGRRRAREAQAAVMTISECGA